MAQPNPGPSGGPAQPGLAHDRDLAQPRTAEPAVHRWWTLTAVCLGTFMLLLDITIVNVALPAIQKDLNSTFSDLQWVVDAYALTLAASLLTSGSVADMYGRRRLYLIGLALFTVASLLCGVATDTLFLQLSRGLQGVGSAIMFAVSLALLADAFRGKDRGIAFGVWRAITGLAVAIGITIRQVHESRDPHPRRPDWIGFATFTAALAFLVFALIESGEKGFTDSLV